MSPRPKPTGLSWRGSAGKVPKIPADLLIRHVLRVVPATEWPVRVEALDALLRRVDSVKKDGLGINSRLPGGSPLGVYSTKKRASGVRPYRSMLIGFDPIEARCDCPDFLKNSLGLYKHVLILLEFLHARPKLLKRAMGQQGQVRPTLSWDPIRPLEGPGDWLARVTLIRPADAKPPKGSREAKALEWFRPVDGEVLSPIDAYPGAPSRRLELVEDLIKLLGTTDRERQDPALVALLGAERDRLRQGRKRGLGRGEISEAIGDLKREAQRIKN